MPVLKNQWSDAAIQNFWNHFTAMGLEYFADIVGADVLRIAKLPTKRKLHMADLGGGSGRVFRHISKYYPLVDYTLFDVAEKSIVAANEEFSNHLGFHGAEMSDAIWTGKFDGCFDWVISMEVIEHLDDVELDKYAQLAKRICKVGGKFLITTLNNENLDENMVYCPGTDQYFHPVQHVRSWTAQKVEESFSAYGFKCVRAIETTLIQKSRLRFARKIWGTVKRRKPQNLIMILERYE